ncbi:MAG: hypothetical protein ACOX7R_06640 [Acetivibrionales bacterium]|jgi:ribosome maturation factor RimP
MFSGDGTSGSPLVEIGEKIKYDLIKTFSDKGIEISKILIDMQEDRVNIRVYINKQCKSGMKFQDCTKVCQE